MEDVVRQAAEVLVGTALATGSETVRIATSDVASALWSRLKGLFTDAGGPSSFGDGEAVPLAEVVDALAVAHGRDPEAFARAVAVVSGSVIGTGNAIGGSSVVTGGSIVGGNQTNL